MQRNCLFASHTTMYGAPCGPQLPPLQQEQRSLRNLHIAPAENTAYVTSLNLRPAQCKADILHYTEVRPTSALRRR